MQTVFFINPTAGSKNAADELVPKIRAAARNTGIPVEIYQTDYAGQAREMAQKYAAGGQKVHLFACGGDGTLNEVLQGVAGHANAAQEVRSDLIRSTQGYGIDIFAAGIDAQVANGIPKWRRVPFCGGSTAYTLSILEAVCSSFQHRLRIRADHIDIEGTFMMLAVCNGQQYGGGYCAAPNARMDDGLLDVVLLKPVPRIRLPGLLGAYKKGAHLLPDDTITPPFAPYMTFFRTKSIDIRVLDNRPLITTLDGECSPQRHIHAEAVPRAATLLLPPGVCTANRVLQTIGE